MNARKPQIYEGLWMVATIMDAHNIQEIQPRLARVGPVYQRGNRNYRYILWGMSGGSGYGADEDMLSIVKVYYSYQGRFFYQPAGPDTKVSWTKVPDSVQMRVHYQYNLDYSPANDWTYKKGEGWLSPDGLWYPCKYGEHTYWGEVLYSLYYGDPVTYEDDWNGDESLFEKGWVAVRDTGYLSLHQVSHRSLLTEIQLRRLRQMGKDDPEFLDRLDRLIAAHKEVNKNYGLTTEQDPAS